MPNIRSVSAFCFRSYADRSADVEQSHLERPTPEYRSSPQGRTPLRPHLRVGENTKKEATAFFRYHASLVQSVPHGERAAVHKKPSSTREEHLESFQLGLALLVGEGSQTLLGTALRVLRRGVLALPRSFRPRRIRALQRLAVQHLEHGAAHRLRHIEPREEERVHVRHQSLGALVRDAPERDHRSAGPRAQGSARQANHPLAADLAHACVAGAQHDSGATPERELALQLQQRQLFLTIRVLCQHQGIRLQLSVAGKMDPACLIQVLQCPRLSRTARRSDLDSVEDLGLLKSRARLVSLCLCEWKRTTRIGPRVSNHHGLLDVEFSVAPQHAHVHTAPIAVEVLSAVVGQLALSACGLVSTLIADTWSAHCPVFHSVVGRASLLLHFRRCCSSGHSQRGSNSDGVFLDQEVSG
eukprot:3107967-Rhodomonas_salina.2